MVVGWKSREKSQREKKRASAWIVRREDGRAGHRIDQEMSTIGAGSVVGAVDDDRRCRSGCADTPIAFAARPHLWRNCHKGVGELLFLTVITGHFVIGPYGSAAGPGYFLGKHPSISWCARSSHAHHLSDTSTGMYAENAAINVSFTTRTTCNKMGGADPESIYRMPYLADWQAKPVRSIWE
jgi:hypothetical protein